MTAASDDRIDFASLVVAHDEGNAFDAVVPPIVQTSLFTFSSYAEMEETYRGLKVRPTYTRGLNPTVRMFEEMLAKLEGAEDALGFASGMAAISSTVMAFVKPGDRIVCVRHVYPTPTACSRRCSHATASPSPTSTGWTSRRSTRRSRARRSSTWRARRAGPWRRTTSARSRSWPSATAS